MKQLAALVILITGSAFAQRVPLTDLGRGLYLNQFEGGLYENGSNAMPADHAAAGLAQAALVHPMNGTIVMVSIGMSNTTQEFCAAGNPQPCTSWSFVGQADADPTVNHSTLSLINGARGGQSAAFWVSPTDQDYDLIRTQDLQPAGLTEAQVQVAWLKIANPGPTVSLPSQNADAYTLVTQIGNILRSMKTRYPNLRLVYISSRIYAGYASSPLNPEPYAYESGLAVKWVIEAQIHQMRTEQVDSRAGDLNYDSGVAPWIAWGPYMWADGLNARSDGLTWSRGDFQSDGTHPSQSGQQKVGTMLLDFFKHEPTATPWFIASPTGLRRRVVTH